ncbi:6-phospho-3-hexuloisomerase [Lentilactobacillus sp. Marseille-Q4993]|uniref:6-phospho-3-hexuloisomerase n=1 Tax=Lentilactobacillus sp. Marseille-Q4993 TaxID=3039492 RepID=UPI0024BC05A1|nr:6-phospho-3-hexuloisomerase [Lentilactobacillus sp. Marseille-Q4993]
MNDYWSIILSELSAVNVTVTDEFAQLVKNANQVFVFGAGRSGLAIKAFAMRLSQLGKPAFVVGETTNPPIGDGDLFTVASGSGTTSQAITLADKAKVTGAKVALITASPDSPLAATADLVTNLGGKAKYDNDSSTVQPMGSLFEQSVFIFGDAFVLKYMNDFQVSETDMQKRHANLE